MKKLMIFILSLLFLLPSVSVVALAEGESDLITVKNGYYDISPEAYESNIALLVNADTDTVIYSKNADTVTAPASLTKIVTALVVLSKGDSFDTQITCSRAAVDSLLGTGSSIVGLLADEVVSLEMLLYCLFLPSANDAAAVLAEHYGGGDSQVFINEMNELVKALGCTDTHFANPHGLDDETIEGFNGTTQNQTTANDMYKIAKEALSNDKIRTISSKYGKTMPPTNKYTQERYLYNTNALLNDYSPYYYEGAIGLKTGTTDKAGACLISSAKKDGYTYISIAMQGERDAFIDESGQPKNTAFLTCRDMLSWAFDNIKIKVLADKSYNMGEAVVSFGRGADYVALVPQGDITAVVYKDITIDDLTVEYAEGFPVSVDAPVSEGDVIGNACLMYKGLKIADVVLVAQNDVKKNHLWSTFNWLENIMSNKAVLVCIVIAIIVIIILIILFMNNNQKRKRKRNRVEIVKDYSKLAK